jgi:hypothetical protein
MPAEIHGLASPPRMERPDATEFAKAVVRELRGSEQLGIRGEG